jgi:hypothetical protein
VEWIRDHAPANIAAFDFLDIIHPIAALSTNSEFLILTLPVSVWNAMTPNPAVKFQSIVYSQNLLYHDGAGPHDGTLVANHSPRMLAQGGFRELLGNDTLAKRIASLTDELELQSRLVVSLRQDKVHEGHQDTASGWAYNLMHDRSFDVRKRPRNFFRVGKVFLAVASAPFDSGSKRSAGRSTHMASCTAQRPQRFIVVREGLDHCNVVPIATFSGKAREAVPSDLSTFPTIYSGPEAPAPDRQEQTRGMRPKPIRVDLFDRTSGLHPASRLLVSHVMTAMHDTKVLPVGLVNGNSLRDLMSQVIECWTGRLVSTPEETKQTENVSSELDDSSDEYATDSSATDSDDGEQDDGHEGTGGEDEDEYEGGNDEREGAIVDSTKNSRGFLA